MVLRKLAASLFPSQDDLSAQRFFNRLSVLECECFAALVTTGMGWWWPLWPWPGVWPLEPPVEPLPVVPVPLPVVPVPLPVVPVPLPVVPVPLPVVPVPLPVVPVPLPVVPVPLPVVPVPLPVVPVPLPEPPPLPGKRFFKSAWMAA